MHILTLFGCRLVLPMAALLGLAYFDRALAEVKLYHGFRVAGSHYIDVNFPMTKPEKVIFDVTANAIGKLVETNSMLKSGMPRRLSVRALKSVKLNLEATAILVNLDDAIAFRENPARLDMFSRYLSDHALFAARRATRREIFEIIFVYEGEQLKYQQRAPGVGL